MPPVFRRYDLWAVCAVVILALLIDLCIPRQEGAVATVRVNGNATHTLPLQKNTTLTLNNNNIALTLFVQQGKVQVTHSTCPDKICQNTPPIHKAGQTIVCLPAACSVTIEGQLQTDAITY